MEKRPSAEKAEATNGTLLGGRGVHQSVQYHVIPAFTGVPPRSGLETAHGHALHHVLHRHEVLRIYVCHIAWFVVV